MMKPQVKIMHYTAPPIIGGVENVIAQHSRLLVEAGYPVTWVVGRGESDPGLDGVKVVIFPELDSQHPTNLAIARAFALGVIPKDFARVQSEIARALTAILRRTDVVIVHNVFNFHFNLPFTSALHDLIDHHVVRQMIAWCHDISRFVNPASGEALRVGFPWDLLRTFRPTVTYVAVSQHRQSALAQVLGCPAQKIQVIPNGVHLSMLLGLAETSSHLIEEFALLDGNPIMLMPIRITRAKNIEFAIRVTGALKAQGLKPKLVVTGPPDPHSPKIDQYVDELLTLRQDLELSKEVVFVHEGTSRMPRSLMIGAEIVAELYRLTDLVFLPSHREGFGLGVLEAGLIGKPIFCTSMPALAQVGENLVHRIDLTDSPKQVAGRIQSWMQQDRVCQLSQHVRQHLTWSAIFAQTIEPLVQQTINAPEFAS
ncbi:MAG: glycosyltransferase family 4 protein [Chloroflexi bacterium]|nr:glycosyltransferase family 4 protein [Chloroflexota bacterium]